MFGTNQQFKRAAAHYDNMEDTSGWNDYERSSEQIEQSKQDGLEREIEAQQDRKEFGI